MQDAIKAVVEMLETTQRPLNRRRIRRAMCAKPSDEPWDDGYLNEVLGQACSAGTVVEVRPGVYAAASLQNGGREEALEGDHDERWPRRSRQHQRRRSRTARAAEGFPTAPLSLEETAAMSIQADDRRQLGDALWTRLRRRAAEVVGQQVETTQDIPGDEIPLDERDSKATIDDGLDAAREIIRMRMWGDDGGGSTEGESADAPDGKFRPQGQADTERDDGTDDLGFAPRALAGEQYRERRGKDVYPLPGDDRRHPKSTEFDLDEAGPEQIRATLAGFGEYTDLETLAECSEGFRKGSIGALRTAIENANQASLKAGLRPVFMLDGFGKAGLTEWDCTARHLRLEGRVLDLVGEQRESLRRALLKRVSELRDEAFRRLVVFLLTKLGYHEFQEVHSTTTGQVMLTARRDRGVENIQTAVVAQRAWNLIDRNAVCALRDSLAFFSANQGMVISIGSFGPDAIEEASRGDQAFIQLIDGKGLAHLLFEHGLGVQTHQLRLGYPDGPFFDSLDT